MNENLIKKSKTVEELSNRNCNVCSLTLAESFIYYVFDDINRISHDFYDIGARLLEAHQLNYHKELFDGQYATVADLAEGVFGIKKTMAYNLMEVARKYYDGKSFLRIGDKWKSYTQTQLIEMLPLARDEMRVINERDTIADIKEWKRILKIRGIYVFQHCNTLKECLEYAHKLDELNIPATNNFGAFLSASDVKKKIEEFSVQTENIIEEIPDEISVQTEKSIEKVSDEISVQTEKSIEKVPDEISVQMENQTKEKFSVKDFKKSVLTLFAEDIKRGGIKAYFDPDNKGGGTRFVPSALAEITRHFYLQALTKNKTPLKQLIQAYIDDFLNSFDYTITLNGRKQSIVGFAGSLAGRLCNVLEDLTKVNK